MTEAVEKRAIAFIRTIGNRCAACLRRSKDNCSNCISSWANGILRDYDNETKPQIDYSLTARMMMIAECLKKAEAPLLSAEIDLKAYCTKQLKRWTLMKMVRLGYVSRTRKPGKGARKRTYVYSLGGREFPIVAKGN